MVNYFNGLSKYSINSLYYHHQSTPKLCFTIISAFRWNSCGLSKCHCGQRGQNFRKLWRGLQYFASAESIANEDPSELRGF